MGGLSKLFRQLIDRKPAQQRGSAHIAFGIERVAETGQLLAAGKPRGDRRHGAGPSRLVEQRQQRDTRAAMARA